MIVGEDSAASLAIVAIEDDAEAEATVARLKARGILVNAVDRPALCDFTLPAIVDRIGDRAEVYLDGGVRRGTDVITALALGAKAVFIGRPYLYGLAAAGEAGVGSILEIFREEIKRALILMGCPSTAALDRNWLIRADADPLGALTK